MEYAQVKVLDHGYLQLIESWGSDERIVEAARMSVDEGFVSWEPYLGHAKGDMGLLNRLQRKAHTSPIEAAGLTVEVGCPVVVVWQWVRHRTLSYNILSGRYAPMPEDNYIPSVERLMITSKTNKQAGAIEGAKGLTEAAAKSFQEMLAEKYANDEKLYQWALAVGVPKELARLHLPFARYTRMRVTGNLLNWLWFLALRVAPEAQWEIRQYANMIGTIISGLFPRTWELFIERK